jgi:hypothetical protein
VGATLLGSALLVVTVGTPAMSLPPGAPPVLDVSAQVTAGPNTGSTTVAEAGDTVSWKVLFSNDPGSVGDGVEIVSPILPGQSFVPGSLNVPGDGSATNWAGTYSTTASTNPADYSAIAEPAGVLGVGMTHPTNGLPTAYGGTADFPAPLESFTAGQGGGDGMYAIFYGDNVYNIHHHRPVGVGTQLECHDKNTGLVCAGWGPNGANFSAVAGDAIGTGADVYNGGYTPGEYLDAATGQLHWPVQTTNTPGATNTVGMACVDLSNDTSCGFTPVITDALPLSPNAQWSGNARIGTKLYGIDSRERLLCWDASTNALCAGYPLTLNGALGADLLGLSVATVEAYDNRYVFASGTRAPLGTEILDLFCIDTTTNTPCAAGYPIIGIPTPGSQVRLSAPALSGTGAVIGACWERSATFAFIGWECRGLDGAAVPPPAWSVPPGTATVGVVGYGSTLRVGTKAYLHYSAPSNPATTTYSCFDFSINAACAGFAQNSSGVAMSSYSIRQDPANPGCLWAVGDLGRFEVFNAETGEFGCATTSASLSVTPADYYCDASASHIDGYDRLTVGDLTAGDYSAALLTIRDGANAIIPGWNAVDVTADLQADGETSIAGLSYATYPDVSVEIAFSGVNDAPFTSAQKPYVNITWAGDPYELCYSTTIADSCDVATIDSTPSMLYLPRGDAPRTTGAAYALDYIATAGDCFGIEKSVASVESLGGSDYRIIYDIGVSNLGVAEGRYDLEDEFAWGAGMTSVGAPVAANVNPGGVVLEAAWTGVAPNLTVASDVSIDADADHTYRITAVAHVPAATSVTDLDCTLLESEDGTGIMNAARLVPPSGDPVEASACATLPPPGALASTGFSAGGLLAPGLAVIGLGIGIALVARRRLAV